MCKIWLKPFLQSTKNLWNYFFYQELWEFVNLLVQTRDMPFSHQTLQLFTRPCTFNSIQVGSDVASYPWQRCRGNPLASNFFFSIFGITFCVRERRDFCLSVLNGLRRKIASILDLFLNGLPHVHILRILAVIPTNTKAMDVVRCPGWSLVPVCKLSSAYTSKYILSHGFEGFQLCFFFMPQRTPLLSTSAPHPFFCITVTNRLYWWMDFELPFKHADWRTKLVLLVISTGFHVSTKLKVWPAAW